MKLLYFFVAVSCLYISCSQPSSPTPPPSPPLSATLKVDKQTVSLAGRVNAIDSINIESGNDWSIAFSPVLPSWLGISDMGGKGNKRVFLTTKEVNNTGSSRSVKLSISPLTGGASFVVTVEQRTNDELTISAVNPTRGVANTIVTISGTGFNLDSSLDSVFFNGKPASIVSATATSITIKVPVGAGTGPVSVKVNNTTVVGPVFNYELSPVVVFIAGSGFSGSADGIGAAASFTTPTGLCVDNAGNIYVADFGANTVRKITPSGAVSTLAGSVGKQGNNDGVGTDALFQSVFDVAVDASSNVFVADYWGSRIRKITPAGVVTTFAKGMVFPSGITIDNDGFIYTVSGFLSEVRKIAADATWIPLGSYLRNAFDVTVDAAGYLYITDSQDQTISKISPDGIVTKIAGVSGTKGFNNGEGSSATFNTPKSIAVDKFGNLYVADPGNNAIRKITPSGTVSTYLENVARYTTDAAYFGCFGVTVDKNDVVYFTSSENKVFKIEMK
jgi:hypothetical protein